MTVDHLLTKVVRRVVILVRGLEANARITALQRVETHGERGLCLAESLHGGFEVHDWMGLDGIG